MISTSEAARRAGIARQNVLAAIKAGTLKATPIEGEGGRIVRWAIAEADLDRWMEHLAKRRRPGPKKRG